MNMMFADEIRRGVAEILRDEDVTVQEVDKGNGVVKLGICIRSKDSNLAPTIYPQEDLSIEENIKNVIKIYKDSRKPSIDMGWFTDYEIVKRKLAIMLISKPIKGVVKRKAPGFEDLYMHAYVIVDELPMGGTGTIKVKEEHLKSWGVSNARLFSDALKSSPFTRPAKRIGMIDMFKEMGSPVPVSSLRSPFDILTNREGTLGAAAILYTKVKANTIMVPSSKHEVLLIEDNGQNKGSNDDLNEIIRSVNCSILNPEDYLGDHAYRYNGKKWESLV